MNVRPFGPVVASDAVPQSEQIGNVRWRSRRAELLAERGVALTRLCQKALGDAERKIRVLAKGPDGELREQDFEAPETD